MNPSPIKKIINKKVTSKALNDYPPVKKRRSPNIVYPLAICTLLLFQIKIY
jgi:hypothetical protein